MYLELIGPREHLLGRAIGVGLGERRAFRPRREVIDVPPPRLHLVEATLRGILDERPGLVVELHRSGAVNLVSDESGGLVHEMRAPLESVLEVDHRARWRRGCGL